MTKRTATIPSRADTAATVVPVIRRKCACGAHTHGAADCRECSKHRQHGDMAVHDGQLIPRAAGKALDASTRARFESAFGRDFSSVRVHSDTHAARSAHSIDAAAYTVGNDVVFGAGQYQPHTETGAHLLAHELAHVAQFRSFGRPSNAHAPLIGHPSDPAERDADLAAKRAMQGQSVRVARPADASVHRLSTGEIAGITAGAIGGAALIGLGIAGLVHAFACPGPGISVSASRSEKSAQVNARMQVSGADADPGKAGTIQNIISSFWNVGFPDGYRVSTNVSVAHRADGQDVDGNAAQIELVHAGTDPSNVAPSIHGKRMQLNLDKPLALTWTPAHEFGHLLCLGDRYTEGRGPDGQRMTTPDSGYQNNIMGTPGKPVESINVQELVNRYAS